MVLSSENRYEVWCQTVRRQFQVEHMIDVEKDFATLPGRIDMKRKEKKLLYRSFDDALTPEERKQLDELLSASAELRAEHEKMIRLRQRVSVHAPGHFKPFFAERVTNEIKMRQREAVQDPFYESLVSAFKPAIVAATILFFALVSYNLIKSEKISVGSAFAEPEVSLDQALDPTIILTME